MPLHDSVTSRLLVLLQENARRTNRELARAVGIADSTCLERVRGLERDGTISGYHAEVDLDALNRPVQAIIIVRLQPKSRQAVETFREFVFTLPETLAVFVVSGSDDFIVQVAVSSTAHLEAFVLDHVAVHPNIADLRTSLVYEHLKRRSVEPLEPPSPARSPREGRRSRQ